MSVKVKQVRENRQTIFSKGALRERLSQSRNVQSFAADKNRYGDTEYARESTDAESNRKEETAIIIKKRRGKSNMRTGGKENKGQTMGVLNVSDRCPCVCVNEMNGTVESGNKNGLITPLLPRDSERDNTRGESERVLE